MRPKTTDLSGKLQKWVNRALSTPSVIIHVTARDLVLMPINLQEITCQNIRREKHGTCGYPTLPSRPQHNPWHDRRDTGQESRAQPDVAAVMKTPVNCPRLRQSIGRFGSCCCCRARSTLIPQVRLWTVTEWLQQTSPCQDAATEPQSTAKL